MSKLKLFLFGAPYIEYDGQEIKIRRRKALAIAAYLALANKAIRRDVLGDFFWPDAEIDQARASLRTAIYSLKSINNLEWLNVQKHQISLNHDLVDVDCALFSKYIAQVRLHDHETLCEECFNALNKAEALYRGGFLADFDLDSSAEFDDWRQLQATILQREYAGVLRRIAEHYHTVHNDTQQAINYALHWLALDNLHEPAHRMLMRFYHESGQRTQALRQYQACVDILDEELATVPEDETILLYEQILEGKPIERKISEASSSASSFLPALPPLVVGREEAVKAIKERLGIGGKQRSNVVIHGLPGVGKSTIMAHLAHDAELANIFPDGVLWTSLGEQPEILSKLQLWATALGLGEENNTTVEALSARISAKLQDKRVLILVDDVWQIEHSKPFRVGSSNASIVFSSRLYDVASALSPSQLDLYNLAVLSETSALKLLEMLTPNTVEQFPKESLELVQDLEGLPLAIQVAGRLLQNEQRLGWGVVDLLAELREGASLLNAEAPSDMMQQDTTPTVATLLKRSTDTLKDNTKERFALLGLFVPKPATFDLGAMSAIWDVNDPKPTARELVNRGLLEPVGGGRFQMHALLVLHARSMLEEK